MLKKFLKALIPDDVTQSPKTVDGTPSVPDFNEYVFLINEAFREAGFYEAKLLPNEKGVFSLEFMQENIPPQRLQAIKDLAWQTLDEYYSLER